MGNIGRIGNNQLTREFLFNIRHQLAKQNKLFEQISSNKRINRPSDDPIGSKRILELHQQMLKQDEYKRNIDTGELWTNISMTALDSASSVWNRLNELAISSIDGSKSEENLLGIAEEIDQLLKHFVQITNTSNAGVYLFSGGKTDTPPFTAEENIKTGRIERVFYQGDDFIRQIKTNDAGVVDMNVLGSNAGDPQKKGVFIDSNKDLNAFDIMIQLRDRLLDNNVIGLSNPGGLLSNIEEMSTRLNLSRVEIAGAQEVLSVDRNRVLSEHTDIAEYLSEIEEIDAAQAILELNNAQNVYEAAIASAGRMMQGGLVRFL